MEEKKINKKKKTSAIRPLGSQAAPAEFAQWELRG